MHIIGSTIDTANPAVDGFSYETNHAHTAVTHNPCAIQRFGHLVERAGSLSLAPHHHRRPVCGRRHQRWPGAHVPGCPGQGPGQANVGDQQPGASGAIAAQFVARSKGDGYTLLYPNNGVLTSPLLNDKAGYDAFKDFKPISLTTAVPMVLVTNKSVPATDTKSFLDYVRKQPNGVMYASAGTASYGHLSSARLAQLAGM